MLDGAVFAEAGAVLAERLRAARHPSGGRLRLRRLPARDRGPAPRRRGAARSWAASSGSGARRTAGAGWSKAPSTGTQPVALMDDILNSGRSAARAAALLRTDGFQVAGVVTLFNFTWSGGARRGSEAEGLWVESLAGAEPPRERAGGRRRPATRPRDMDVWRSRETRHWRRRRLRRRGRLDGEMPPPAPPVAPGSLPGASAVPPEMEAQARARCRFSTTSKSCAGASSRRSAPSWCASIACLFFTGFIVDEVLLGPTRSGFFMYDVLAVRRHRRGAPEPDRHGSVFRLLRDRDRGGRHPRVAAAWCSSSWKFIEPGLYPAERQGLRFAAVFASFFFALGIAFGYLIITPIALQFFAQFQISDTRSSTSSTSRSTSRCCSRGRSGPGILFELPVVVDGARQGGRADPGDPAGNGRPLRASIIILVLSALLTPPDPWSQVLMGDPAARASTSCRSWFTGIVERQRLKRARGRRARGAAAERNAAEAARPVGV